MIEQVFNSAGHGTVRGMRHVWTLIAAIVITPVAWLLIAFGQTQAGHAFDTATKNDAWSATAFVWPLIFLAGAGLLLGLLATLRFSPLGAVVTGLVFVASYVVLMADGKALYTHLDYTVTILKHDAQLPAPITNGTTLVLGALLLVGVASVARWRRLPVAAPALESPIEAPAAPDLEGSTDDTRDFWTPATPVTNPLTPYPEESSTERVGPSPFGSPWRTPPGERNNSEER